MVNVTQSGADKEPVIVDEYSFYVSESLRLGVEPVAREQFAAREAAMHVVASSSSEELLKIAGPAIDRVISTE